MIFRLVASQFLEFQFAQDTAKLQQILRKGPGNYTIQRREDFEAEVRMRKEFFQSLKAQ